MKQVHRDISASLVGRPGRAVSFARAARLRSAFTITELLVVIGIIALVLAVVIPGLSGMTRDAKITAAISSVSGLCTRASILAEADQRMVAIRACPAEWDRSLDFSTPVSPVGRQHLALYNYTASAGTLKQGNGGLDIDIELTERFERRKDVDALELPADVWVAPLEVWRYSTTAPRDARPEMHPYSGARGKFEFDATAPNNQFVDGDDFLVVFDSQVGLRLPTWVRDADGVRPSTFALKAFDPGDSASNRPASETDRLRDAAGNAVLQNGQPVRFKRTNSAGFVFYPREQFMAASGSGRQDAGTFEAWFRRLGRPYFVQRFGGGLAVGAPQ